MFSGSQIPVWLIVKFKDTVPDSKVDELFRKYQVGAMMKFVINPDGSLTKVFLFSSGVPIESVKNLIKQDIPEVEWVRPSTGENIIDAPGSSMIGETSGFLGMDTTTILILGGVAVAAFILLKRKK